MKLTIRKAQHWLAGIWIGAAILFLGTVFVQTVVFSAFGDQATQVWKWALAAVVPTASLMVGVLVAQTAGKTPAARRADGFVFAIALGLSLAYLAALGVTLAAAAWKFSLKPIEQAELFLQACNGLVAAALGAFFVKHTQDAAAANSRPPREHGAAEGQPAPSGAGPG